MEIDNEICNCGCVMVFIDFPMRCLKTGKLIPYGFVNELDYESLN